VAFAKKSSSVIEEIVVEKRLCDRWGEIPRREKAVDNSFLDEESK
jgi:hypothetical protein